MTLSLRRSRASRLSIFDSSFFSPRPSASLRLQSLGGDVEQLALPLVEDAGLELVLLAQIGDGDFVGQMAAQDGGLVVGAEAARRRSGSLGLLSAP